MIVDWFRFSSFLYLNRGRVVVSLTNGSEGRIVSWRRAWFGPALSIEIDGVVTHGWDPATVVKARILV